MTSDKIQIQIFADWPKSHAKRATKDNGQNPLSHCIRLVRVKCELTDQDSSGGKTIYCPDVKYMLIEVGDNFLLETALNIHVKELSVSKSPISRL